MTMSKFMAFAGSIAALSSLSFAWSIKAIRTPLRGYRRKTKDERKEKTTDPGINPG